MADYGIKIALPTKDVSSSTRDDFAFWSKYQSLPLLYKTTVSITVNSGSCVGTYTYTHNLGFAPFVIGAMTPISLGSRVLLPVDIGKTGEKLYCSGDIILEIFDLRSKVNTIDILYEVDCVIAMFGGRCIDLSKTYDIDLYLYMFELGST